MYDFLFSPFSVFSSLTFKLDSMRAVKIQDATRKKLASVMPVAKRNQQLPLPLTPHGLSMNSVANGTIPSGLIHPQLNSGGAPSGIMEDDI